ncbi:MAG: hypothetical protein AAB738_01175 [Patescibacteria group bacterium]
MPLKPITYHLKPTSGTSLVEIILYVGLTATILLGISALIATTLQSRVKSQTITEVDSQGLMVMQIITQSIRNAQAINSPGLGTVSSTLSLSLPSINPVIYNLATGTIRITEATGQPIPLTNLRVLASGLNFYNLSRAGTSGTIQIQFKLTHLNPQNRNEYDYSKTFISSASLR